MCPRNHDSDYGAVLTCCLDFDYIDNDAKIIK